MAQTVEQRDAALALANSVRVRRADWRRATKEGRVGASEVCAMLRDPVFASMAIMTFLTAFPGVGISKANEQLRRFRVAPTATLGRLTARQVHEVEQFVWERLT
jgi:hypothetical protein